MEVAEFISERGIDTETDFIWWVTFTLRNRDRIIAAVISGKKRVSYKYGVQLPSTFQEEYDLYKANSNTLWNDDLNNYMENLKCLLKYFLVENLLHFNILKQVNI